jgi:hypothetical protein
LAVSENLCRQWIAPESATHLGTKQLFIASCRKSGQ